MDEQNLQTRLVTIERSLKRALMNVNEPYYYHIKRLEGVTSETEGKLPALTGMNLSDSLNVKELLAQIDAYIGDLSKNYARSYEKMWYHLVILNNLIDDAYIEEPYRSIGFADNRVSRSFLRGMAGQMLNLTALTFKIFYDSLYGAVNKYADSHADCSKLDRAIGSLNSGLMNSKNIRDIEDSELSFLLELRK